MSLLHRLSVLFIFVLLPLIAIEVWNQFDLRRMREAEVRDQAARVLGLIEAEHVRLVDGIRHIMVTLRQTRSLREQNMAACQDLLDRVRRDYPPYLDIYVGDRNGQVGCSTDKGGIGINFSGVFHVRRAMETGTFVVGHYVKRLSDGLPVLPFAIPYSDGVGQPIGVLTAVLDLRWLGDYIATTGMPPNTAVTLVDAAGVVLARIPEMPDIIGRPIPLSYRHLLMGRERGTVELPGLDGVTRILAYSPPGADATNLLITVGFDRDQAYQGIEQALWRSLALIFAVLAGSLLCAWWGVSQYLHRPISVLRAATDRWRSGDQAARAQLGGGVSEIVSLAAAFDSMAEDLQRKGTERERAFAETRKAEARLRAIFDTAADAIVVLDDSGAIQAFNSATTQMFGYESEELAGRGLELLVTDPPGCACRLSDCLRPNEAGIVGSRCELEGRRKDGSVFPIDVSIGEWRADGRRFLTVMTRDVTERREAERRVQSSSALLETIIESIPDPIFVKDMEGQYLVANGSTCRVFGIEPDRLHGLRDQDLFPADVVAGIEAGERRIRSTGSMIAVEEEIPDATSGEMRFYLTTKAPLRDATGAIVGVVGIARDITERKRSEDVLRAAKAEAERASVAKSKFLAAASHDLRQPVQSLVLFMAVLRDRLEGQASGAVLDAMEQALHSLRGLLDSLLDVSRLDAGLVVASPVPLPVGPLLQGLAAEYAPRAAAQGLGLRVVESGAVVLSDPTLLERMLRNLVENAVRYTERGGILIGCRMQGERLRIDVVDTGIGIAPERQGEVFEEFFQIGNPERDRSKGLGLGLAVVRRLARLLGHELRVRSVPGRGSTFSVEVPLAAPAAPALGAADGREPLHEAGRVLVVDDEALVRMGLQAMIEGWGYDVASAGTVAEAVEVVQRGFSPEVLLVDYRLRAGETGLHVIRAVKGRIGDDVPAAIVTGDTAPERLAEAKAGGYRLLHKPVAARELRSVVSDLMARARAV
ncbi:PAS domain S-box protein [Arenibaculum pallidiluteum]|uniref:PAS domain S-box protein n=1 Tax=Arenibaculum pallidiluteum TaxID=2812559 RepID=UPI001A9605D7|nr:PAS domain S-box protein [Arenibaculum pallidiluteum]